MLDERKFEFAGENMRWKDLVRNNLLAENTYYNFLRYLVCGENGAGQSAYQEMVEEYDGMPEYLDKLPSTVYYMIGANPQTPSVFPNTSLRIIDIYNPYDDVVVSTVPDEYRALTVQYPYAWASDAGVVNAQCLYSFYGYIYCDQISGLVYLNTNGKYVLMPRMQMPVCRRFDIFYLIRMRLFNVLPVPIRTITVIQSSNQ